MFIAAIEVLAEVGESTDGYSIDLTAIIVAFIGTAGAVLSYLQASKVRRQQRALESRVAEADAYERARDFDTQTVEQIRKEVKRLRGLLKEEQNTNDSLRAKVVRLDDIEENLDRLHETLSSEREVSKRLRHLIVGIEVRIRNVRDGLLGYLDGRASEGELEVIIEEIDALLEDGLFTEAGGSSQ